LLYFLIKIIWECLVEKQGVAKKINSYIKGVAKKINSCMS